MKESPDILRKAWWVVRTIKLTLFDKRAIHLTPKISPQDILTETYKSGNVTSISVIEKSREKYDNVACLGGTPKII